MALMQIREYLAVNEDDTKLAAKAMMQYDSIDFEALLANSGPTTKFVFKLFAQGVPRVHWYHLMEAFSETLGGLLKMPEHASQIPVYEAEVQS